MHGIPEELSSDGGSTYMAYETQKFLADYGVKHRVSSVAYPHSNQRAELAVKSMKRLLRENTCLDGSLNSDRFLRAVMSYRNTPDRDTGRSPAQVIFGRNLRDFLPAPLSRYRPQPQWILLRDDRERALRKRALRNMEQLEYGSKSLAPLEIHDTVQVQNQVGNHPSRWDITGTIVEAKGYDQYVVKIHGSGRLTVRNRKFLKKIMPYASDHSLGRGTQTIIDEFPSKSIAVDNSLEEQPMSQESTLSEDDLNEPTIDLEEPQEQPLRRSSRIRQSPQRLNIKSTKGQSYLCSSRPTSQSVSPTLPSI